MEKDNVAECLTEEQEEGLAITSMNEVIQLFQDLFRQRRYRLIRGLADKLQRESNIWHEELGRYMNLAACGANPHRAATGINAAVDRGDLPDADSSAQNAVGSGSGCHNG